MNILRLFCLVDKTEEVMAHIWISASFLRLSDGLILTAGCINALMEPVHCIYVGIGSAEFIAGICAIAGQV